MRNLVKLLDGFKISDPKVFMLVTLIANIVVGVLDYYGMYGSEDIKPVVLAVTSIVTIILSYIGVRTTRFIQNDRAMNDTVSKVIEETVADLHVDAVINDALNKTEHDLEEIKSFDKNLKQ